MTHNALVSKILYLFQRLYTYLKANTLPRVIMPPKTRHILAASKAKAIAKSSNVSKRSWVEPPLYQTYLTANAEERAKVIATLNLYWEREVDQVSIATTDVPEVI